MESQCELRKYQLTGEAFDLIEKHRTLISRIARLAKGNYKNNDSQKAWFYGLFLEGKPSTPINLRNIEKNIQDAMYWASYTGVYNQVVVFFLELAGRYKPYKSSTPFRRYIRMVLGWRMKHWVNKYLNESWESARGSEVWAEDFYMLDVYPATIEPFRMSIAWILNGSKGPSFRKNFRPYDRYLLYLYFANGYTIRQIADLTQKSKNTINKDLNHALDICRENLTSEV